MFLSFPFYFAGASGVLGTVFCIPLSVADVVFCVPAVGAAFCWEAPNPGVVFGFVVCVSVADCSSTLLSVTALGTT